MPQPLVVDSGAAQTVRLRTWFPNHKTEEPGGSKRGIFCTTAGGSTVEQKGEKTLLMTTSVANVSKALASVSKVVRNGNRVVFDTSGIENKTAKDILWYVVDMVEAAIWNAVHITGPVSPNETTEEQGMWDKGKRWLHAMVDDEKIDEGKGETEIGDEEEGHQKARTIASSDIPSRRQVDGSFDWWGVHGSLCWLFLFLSVFTFHSVSTSRQTISLRLLLSKKGTGSLLRHLFPCEPVCLNYQWNPPSLVGRCSRSRQHLACKELSANFLGARFVIGKRTRLERYMAIVSLLNFLTKGLLLVVALLLHES